MKCCCAKDQVNGQSGRGMVLADLLIQGGEQVSAVELITGSLERAEWGERNGRE